jgi:hypothetical protein
VGYSGPAASALKQKLDAARCGPGVGPGLCGQGFHHAGRAAALIVAPKIRKLLTIGREVRLLALYLSYSRQCPDEVSILHVVFNSPGLLSASPALLGAVKKPKINASKQLLFLAAAEKLPRLFYRVFQLP